MSLDKLKMLRTRRMERQFIESQTRRTEMQAWESHVSAHQQRITSFQQWRQTQQEHLFHALQSQPFTPQGLAYYHTELEYLQTQESQLTLELLGIQQQLAAAQARFEMARQASTQANIKLEKLKEIIHVVKKSAAKPDEVAADEM